MSDFIVIIGVGLIAILIVLALRKLDRKISLIGIDMVSSHIFWRFFNESRKSFYNARKRDEKMRRLIKELQDEVGKGNKDQQEIKTRLHWIKTRQKMKNE